MSEPLAPPAQTVYLVWTGCYSDKDVVAVCTTREKADAVVAWILTHDRAGRTRAEAEAAGADWYCMDSDARVTEVALDSGVPGADGRVPYAVEFDADGNVTWIDRSDAWFGPPTVWGPLSYGRTRAQVRATDEKHAVKIAADLRAQKIAQEATR